MHSKDKLTELREIAQDKKQLAAACCAQMILRNRKRDLRSKWYAGCACYACEIAQKLAEEPQILCDFAAKNQQGDFKRIALRAATGHDGGNAGEASYGGRFLIWNGDICDRLSTEGEKKLRRGGILPPNSSETWCDVQARAIEQAIFNFSFEICAAGALFAENFEN